MLSVGFSGWVVNPGANVNIDADIADVNEINKCLAFDDAYSPEISSYTINGFLDESSKSVTQNGSLAIPFQMKSSSKTFGQLMGTPASFNVSVTLMSTNTNLQFFNKIDISEAKIEFSNTSNSYQTGSFANSVVSTSKSTTSDRVYDASFDFKNFPYFESHLVACKLIYNFSLSKNINFTTDIFNKLGDNEEFSFRLTMGITI